MKARIIGREPIEVPSTDLDVKGISHLSGFLYIDADTLEVFEEGGIITSYFKGEFYGDGLDKNREKVIVLGKVEGQIIARSDNPHMWEHYEFRFTEPPIIRTL